ncbi:retroviral-like aspartic protease family protein [Halomarina litorea]|uniref:retroviral-like aspartic protease family protein n=1 Tax=Halomarina litorea TaxID=2961595 RepID=UPI0020C52614|nr:retroviral-like aspartic protease family protein [Halomarina sp. BCD28]
MTPSPIVGLVERTVFTGTHSSASVLVKCDTGARRTSLDSDVARTIGAGEGTKTVRVRSSNGVQTRAVHPFTVELRGRTHDVLASVTDRSAMRYDAILGRDVLSSYLVDASRA